MTIEVIEKNDLHARLSKTGTTLHSMFWGKKRAQVFYKSENSEGGSFSAIEMLVLLQHIAEVCTERVKRMVEGEAVPATRDFDIYKHLKKVNLEDESVKGNLSDFMEARSLLFRHLFHISDEDWVNRKIKHEAYGEISLIQLLSAHVLLEEKFTTHAQKALTEYAMSKA